MSTEEKSRIAEMAVELMGAQAMKTYITEIWETASPEVKKTLADAILTQLGTSLHDPQCQWEVDKVLERRVVAATKEQLESPTWREKIRSKIDKMLLERWETVVTREVERSTEQAVRGVLGQIADALHKVRGQ